MTNMTESTELQAFERWKDGQKVAVKISLCICVVLPWDELKSVYWHKSLQFVKKSNITLLPCLFMILLAVSIVL